MKIIEQDFSQTDKRIFAEIQTLMSNWRQYLLPTDHEPAMVLNIPYFQDSKPVEDDIFVFHGFVKPGVHTVYVYDPETDEFLESNQIFIREREAEIQNAKEEQHDEEQNIHLDVTGTV